MSKNANMDELHDSPLSAGSSSPKKQPALDLRDEFVSQGSEQVVQKSETTENEHIGLTEVGVRQRDCDTVANLKMLDSSTKNSSFESTNIESLEQKQVVAHDIGKECSAETGVVVSSELPRLENLDHSNGEQISLVKEDPISNSTVGDFRLPYENGATIYTFDNLESTSCDAPESVGLQQSEPAEKDGINVAGQSALDEGAPVLSRKRKSSVLPPVSSRVLRSRSKETPKATEPKVVDVGDSANEGRKRKRRMKTQMKNIPVNEFSRIRTHLRYLLHRVKYEQNLIDAYSGEGWKGQSLEKIKPEKELQRARSQIFRYKLKIRDLFQHLDRSLAQGKLPESLFDTEGQIDSEDIFCAKCGSKDLTIENDIVLCDGACERGFHQFCLDPPLSKEDIPPDDEGWLCPGCDCKVDCVQMLNYYQGSTLTILDNWEMVFPEEAAAAASGKSLDDIVGLPSDDSEDDDYTPCDPGLDNEVSGDESSSDGSDYFSASDDAVPSPENKQNLDLPSDDSEDDEYDPSASGHDQHTKQESSSSDFTSDSEDLDAILEDAESSGKDEGHVPSVSDHSKPNAVTTGEKFKAGTVKRVSLNDELSYLMESNAVPVSGKRQVERLDYKKLHDETYGDATSDSSDEDYGETDGQKRRKSSARKAIRIPTNEIQGRNNGTDIMDGNQNQKENDHAVERKSHKMLKVEGSNNKLGESKSSAEVDSSGKNASRPYKRLGEAVSQRLVESFTQNQYPKQDVKESLAKELGLRVQQVSKWFENARWSFHHSSRMESKMAAATSRNGTSSPRINEMSPGAGQSPLSQSPSCNGVRNIASSQVNPGDKNCQTTDAGEGKSVSEASGKKCRTRNSMVGDQGSSAENFSKQDLHADTPKSQAARKSSRIHTRSDRSIE